MSKFANLFRQDGQGGKVDNVSGRAGAGMEHIADRTSVSDVPAEGSDGTGFRLLFVDDDEGILGSLKRVFMDENYVIHTALTGEEALKIMKTAHVNLVISDYKMPGMTGTEFLREVKAQWPEVIRIMLTGYGDIQAIMGAVNEGAVYKFMTKPWNDDDLRLTVSLALQQYVLMQENKDLKIRTKEQEDKIKSYRSIYSEYTGMLGSILVETGTITEEQLSVAKKKARADEFISDSIARLGFATESQIAKVIQKHQRLDNVDMREVEIDRGAVKLFTHEYCVNKRVIPVKLDGKHLTLAMADPTDIAQIDNISVMTGLNVVPIVATSSDIMVQIEKIFESGGSDGSVDDVEMSTGFEPMEEIDVIIDEDEEDMNINELTTMSGVPPVKRIVNAIILEALRYNASDIHIEPKTKYTVVRFRVDGMLSTKIKVPSNLHAATVSRIKVLAKMDIAERRKPQDGRINIRVGARIVDFRISVIPTISGEKVVIRILDKGSSVKSISALGVFDVEFRKISTVIKKPQGIIISTGPTGSGKTTLLYSLLNEMIDSSKNFETIEDPVEYFVEDANQISVRQKIGLSFANVLRATLRQDPDVILVGEIRDEETADVAFKAAMTGHMVLTTLHTNDTVGSITRLIDVGVKPYLIASGIECIIAQRLVRKVCKHCKKAVKPDKRSLAMLKLPESSVRETVVGQGCNRCDEKGYLGRTGIFELLMMNHEMRQLISGAYSESNFFKLARINGMRTLMDVGVEKVNMGVTTLEELIRVLGPSSLLECDCEQCGKPFNVNFVFCPFCGMARISICFKCRRPLDGAWNVCPSCGTAKGDPGKNEMKQLSMVR